MSEVEVTATEGTGKTVHPSDGIERHYSGRL
jgi:hypothetical protein